MVNNEEKSDDLNEVDPTNNLFLGVIRIPQDRTRLVTNILVFTMILLYYPGSILIEAYNFEVYAGWTALLLWIVFIGPILMTLIFMYNAHARIGLDVTAAVGGVSDADVSDESDSTEVKEDGV